MVWLAERAGKLSTHLQAVDGAGTLVAPARRPKPPAVGTGMRPWKNTPLQCFGAKAGASVCLS
jgi:hypothetical protein